MIQLRVDDMTCGHCASRIASAVRGVDPAGACEIDVKGRSVTISSGEPAARFVEAIRQAGYSAVATGLGSTP